MSEKPADNDKNQKLKQPDKDKSTADPVLDENGCYSGEVHTVRDMAKIKRAENALRESEERFRTIINNTGAGYFFIDLDGNFKHVNDSWLKMHGYTSADEIIGQHYSLTQAEEDLPQAREIAEKLLSGKAINTDEFSRRYRDGSIGFHTFSAHPVIKNGKAIGFEGFIIDITERKQAEKRLMEKDKMLANITSQVPGMLYQFRMKPDGGFSVPYTSQGIKDIFGCSPEDVRDDFAPIFDVVYPEDRDKILRTINESARDLSQWKCEYRVQIPGKPIRWMYGNSIPEKMDDGSIIWSGYNIDISERKQDEADRDNLQSQLANAIEMAHLGPWEYDVATDLFTFNDYFYKVFGTTAAAVGGYKMRSAEYAKRFLHPDDMTLVQEETRMALETDDPNYKRRMEHRIIFSDGTVGYMSVQIFVVKDADGKTIRTYGVNQDITERKRMEAELFKTQKLESIGILAGGIAHDFNNILTTIMGNVSIAKDLTHSKSEIFELLTDAETGAKRAQALTKQLLTFAKGGAPVKETATIKDIIRESSLFVTRGSRSRCDFSIAEDLWPVEADVGQISQVINNIVINANQAMPEGGIIRIKAENHIIDRKNGAQLKPGKYIRISVKDEGTGIAEKYIQKIFDPYFTTKQEGSGLGLATSYSIIHQHNGTIIVESVLGSGTVFRVYLPASEKATPKKNDTLKAVMGSGRILVMDDEDALRKILEKMIVKLGYDTEFAKDGEEAVELFTRARDAGSPFDAVILDLTVSGGMGGKETIKILLDIDPEIKAIVSSGYSDDPVLANFKEYGFRAMIPKPFESRALSRVLYEVLGHKQ